MEKIVEQVLHEVKIGVDGDIKTVNFGSDSVIIDVDDIQNALDGYLKLLVDDTGGRKKSFEKKIISVENLLTITGRNKFYSCKTKIKNRAQELMSFVKKEPGLVCPSSFQSPDAIDLVNTPCQSSGLHEKHKDFIVKIQKWGAYPDTDKRYYLHMVFRYYLSKYHEWAIINMNIIPTPSYQMLLDKLYPNGCKTGFPPEFRTFLDQAGGNDVRVTTLPVPLKGHGKSIKYGQNFESINEVSSLRKFIYNKFVSWTSGSECLYPSFFIEGKFGNSQIKSAFSMIYRNEEFDKNIKLLEDLDVVKMSLIIQTPLNNLKSTYENYMRHNFVTTGEQLKERFNYFMIERRHFYSIEDNNLVETFFGVNSRMDMYPFVKNFCNKNAKVNTSTMSLDNMRLLLDILVDISRKFHFLHKKNENNNVSQNSSRDIILNCLNSLNYV